MGANVSSKTIQKRRYIAMGDDRKGTGFWSVVQSILAAFLGVQSKANKERDFKHGKPIHFIVGGLLGTAIFIFCIWMVVQYFLSTAS